jgi:hypothetical protein
MNPLVIQQLITKLEQSGVSESVAEGAWKFINYNHRSNYINSIYSRDWTMLSSLLMDPLSPQVAYGIMTPIDCSSKEVVFHNDFNRDVSIYGELYGLENLEDLKHKICLKHPWSSHTEMLMTYPDSPRHAHFARSIIELVPTGNLGVEIGGGYGGMSYFLRKFGFQGKLINCDLLETLLVAYAFLSFNEIGVEICFSVQDLHKALGRDEIKVILITPELFDALDELGEIAFVFNSRSLSEMSEEQSTKYLSSVNNAITPDYFISENAEVLLFPNSVRHIERIQDELEVNLSNYNLVSKQSTRFMGGAGRYASRIYKYSNPSMIRN